MRELAVAIYLLVFTIITWPLRFKNSRGKDKEAIKKGQANNYKMARHLCKVILKLTGAQLDIKGIENLDVEGAKVYMGSHKSFFDIVIMIVLIEEPLIFIGKKEVDDLPLIRIWIHSVGALLMDREDIRQSFKVILEAIKELKDGYSVAVFPEGTRSKDRDLLDFKGGSFKLATKSGKAIVPIVMQDTYKLLEENKRLKPAKIRVNIGQAVRVDNLTDEEEKNLDQYTNDYMQSLLDEVTP